ncbi:MAG TPA: BTAD domain-containing putative transcriptional regulator [Actinophytocola sp.]|uniref:AfsR/SARP family transcriptional regulator n=1 Tax=Actinophytocola sp. TaxID=1872138 RepID=UPI002DB6C5C5|nr:BTAD domain-containing putative transcriptional regulator [Actinophytocola sp.]HEU5474261.1 BTAD domain-containing putative transcriptional regulator [Actinophytocola sp.]
MEFRLFGEIQLNAAGRLLDVGAPRQQRVLAALAVDVGRPVPVETLIDRVWDDSPPAMARDVLYPYLSKLRRLLKQATEITGTEARIDKRSAGYVLEIDPDLVDLHRFALLVERGTGSTTADADRATVLAEALDLWRGPPLAGIAGEWVTKTRESWYRLRLDAVVHLGAVLLSLGRATDAIRTLPDLIDEYPLAEPLEALLIRAYHADGRDAEAIDRFGRIKRRLADELGTDPGPELIELHSAILRGELPAAERTNPLATPAQLPPDLYGFAGREDELRLLDSLIDVDSATRIVAVSGTAGVGKTALAVHWAHRVRDRFPDGQLYANLRGFDPTGSPVTPAETVRGFLDAFEVPGKRIPASFEAQVGLYRSLLADRRVLVILDNARSAEQVRPLLAGSPGSLALITSRALLTSLVVAEGAHALDIDLLDVSESHELLAGRLGANRVAAEPVAVQEIIELCARLPLALAVVAARAATHPRFRLAALADELRAARGGLDEFANADPTTDPRAVFSWSYLQLTEPAARLFRLIGLHSGPDIGVRAAASLTGVPTSNARHLLAELARTNLLTEHRPGRYACHDLLRAYASEQATALDPEDDRRAAHRRLLVHYIHSANHADARLDPHRKELPALTGLLPGVSAETMADNDQALAWFNAEHRVLLGAIRQSAELDAEVWELAWAMQRFLSFQGHWHDMLVACSVAVAAAERLDDPFRQAFAHHQMGCAHVWFDEHEEASRRFDIALELYRAAGDLAGQARVEYDHAWNLERQQRNVEAFDHAEKALDLFRAAGHQAGQAKLLNAIGWFHAQHGDYHAALGFCREALELQTTIGDDRGAAQTWHSIGYAHHHLGDHPRAIECYESAIGLCRMYGYPYLEAVALSSLGDTHDDAGDHESARIAWQRSVEILDRLGHTDAQETRAKLANSPQV